MTERLPFTFHFHALEKELATHSSVLAWRIPGTGEPGGLLSMGSHELLCAVCIMLGFLTRLAVLFPLALMLMVEKVIMSSQTAVTDHLFNFGPGYPVMFIGIFIYMLLAGPGKISLDYIIAAHFTENVDDEHVIDNA